MILLNEFLPNPAGADAAGEWVELYNDGGSPVSLAGFWITNAAGKKYFLDGRIGGGEFLILPRTETKLTLRNTDERLTLYASTGGKDTLAFPGAAPEGKSVGRFESETALMVPSPGAPNVSGVRYPALEYPPQTALASSLGLPAVAGLALLCGFLLASAAAFIYIHTHAEKELIH